MAALTTTLAVAALAGTAAQTGLTYAAQRKQARSAEAAGRFEAQMGEELAQDALLRGQEAEAQIERGTRQVVGAQRAALATQGIDVNDGSARQVQEETQQLGDLDRLVLRNNAQREAMGYRRQGQFALQAAQNQAGALRTQSVGTLLTGASNLAGIAYSAGFFERRPPSISVGKLPKPRGKY